MSECLTNPHNNLKTHLSLKYFETQFNEIELRNATEMKFNLREIHYVLFNKIQIDIKSIDDRHHLVIKVKCLFIHIQIDIKYMHIDDRHHLFIEGIFKTQNR